MLLLQISYQIEQIAQISANPFVWHKCESREVWLHWNWATLHQMPKPHDTQWNVNALDSWNTDAQHKFGDSQNQQQLDRKQCVGKLLVSLNSLSNWAGPWIIPKCWREFTLGKCYSVTEVLLKCYNQYLYTSLTLHLMSDSSNWWNCSISRAELPFWAVLKIFLVSLFAFSLK